MKHQTGGTGRPTGNILDFHAILAEIWGSYQGLKVGENCELHRVRDKEAT